VYVSFVFSFLVFGFLVFMFWFLIYLVCCWFVGFGVIKDEGTVYTIHKRVSACCPWWWGRGIRVVLWGAGRSGADGCCHWIRRGLPGCVRKRIRRSGDEPCLLAHLWIGRTSFYYARNSSKALGPGMAVPQSQKGRHNKSLRRQNLQRQRDWSRAELK
jgi:hypothetical protein